LPSGDAAPVPRADDLVGLLEVEMLDRDLFRAPVVTNNASFTSLYGGQVAAQALRAAGLTVPEGRHPHSLHGYFLRRGQVDKPVILQVSRDRDGGSFSSRRVVAVQDGEVIFSMVSSFHVDQDGATYEADGPTDVPDPESVAELDQRWVIDIREVTPTTRRDGELIRNSDRMWARSAMPLPDDRLVHACALVFISDLGSGFGQTSIPGLSGGGSSIDHAVWFHRPIRADEWVLLDLHPVMAGGKRGMYLGTMRDRDGALAGMLSQELLLHGPRRPTS
jgi:acyl-CoA thioesterase-2